MGRVYKPCSGGQDLSARLAILGLADNYTKGIIADKWF